MDEFRVPGFDVVELIGVGSGGEVWLARDQATGDAVAVKRLRPGADLATRDRLRREAAVLAGVDHPHVVRLRSVVGAGEDLVLILDLAAGGSLARLLTARGRRTVGEVVTVAVPLAQALADVHARGLVHGDVTPANVLFAADGRPLLSDLGVSRLPGAGEGHPAGTTGFVDPAVLAGGSPGPAADVYGLAATCRAALSGLPAFDDGGALALPAVHHPLVEVLERGLAPDPSARPTAAELAHAVWASAPAEPVRLTADRPAPGPDVAAGDVTRRVAVAIAGVAAPPQRTRSPHRRRVPRPRWRPALALLLGGAGVAMAAVTGIAWAGAGADSRPGGVPTAAPTVASREVAAAASWAAVLDALDARRARAFARPGVAGLAEVYVDGSPALQRERAVLERLARSGLRAEGLRIDARVVTELSSTSHQARIRVVDVMPAYRLVDGSGTVVAERRGRGEARWTLTLRRSADGGWLIYDVERG